jgi:tetratricopeptide (TPR) repeat protein
MPSSRGRRPGLLAVLIVTTLGVPADAEPLQDPDTQAARRHFDRATELYDQEKYAEAAVEFEAADRLRPSPALKFNVARSLERIERWGEAAAAYRRYLAADPGAANADDLRQRVAVLEQRAGAASPAPTATVTTHPSPRRRRWPIALGVVGGVLVLGGIVTTAVLLTRPATPTFSADLR